uniref:Uncharacterized protein n=1 Tax=Trypanosoma congolense (strain IL3000) TaxID=1068625 RepID=G0UQU1_TRYCI|nr:hypothetical protein, unlikely [Trypanosoma congolense IL3000]
MDREKRSGSRSFTALLSMPCVAYLFAGASSRCSQPYCCAHRGALHALLWPLRVRVRVYLLLLLLLYFTPFFCYLREHMPLFYSVFLAHVPYASLKLTTLIMSVPLRRFVCLSVLLLL